MLQFASNREPPLASTIGLIFPNNMGTEWFLQFFEFFLKTSKDIEYRGDHINVKFRDLQIWF